MAIWSPHPSSSSSIPIPHPQTRSKTGVQQQLIFQERLFLKLFCGTGQLIRADIPSCQRTASEVRDPLRYLKAQTLSSLHRCDRKQATITPLLLKLLLTTTSGRSVSHQRISCLDTVYLLLRTLALTNCRNIAATENRLQQDFQLQECATSGTLLQSQ